MNREPISSRRLTYAVNEDRVSFLFGPRFRVGLGLELVLSGGKGERWGESARSLGRGWRRTNGSWDWKGVRDSEGGDNIEYGYTV